MEAGIPHNSLVTILVASVLVLGLIGLPYGCAPALGGPADQTGATVTVLFRAGVPAKLRNAAIESASGRVLQIDPTFTRLQLVEPSDRATVRGVIRTLDMNPHVLAVQRNVATTTFIRPNDPFFAAQWWAQNTGQVVNGIPTSTVSGADIGLTSAWDITRGRGSTIVAVVDTGLALGHPDLDNNLWDNPHPSEDGLKGDVHGADFVGLDGIASDRDGHGTAVAGIIGAAGDDAFGIAGINWDIQLMAVRVLASSVPSKGGLGLGSNYSLLMGVEYAVSHGAKIVNLSIGRDGSPGQVDVALIKSKPNVLFVAAAGNEGRDIDSGTPATPCAIPAPNLICVTSTTATDALDPAVNSGSQSVDLAAPGDQIVTDGFIPGEKRVVFKSDFETKVSTDWNFSPNWSVTTERASLKSHSALGVATSPFSELQTRTLNLRGKSDCEVSFSAALETASSQRTAAIRVLVSEDGQNGSYRGVTTVAPGRDFKLYRSELDVNNEPRVTIKFQFSKSTPPGTRAFIDNVSVRCLPPVIRPTLVTESGTSFAAPMVSGAAALLLSVRPNATVSELRKALLESGDPLPALKGKTVTGRRLNVMNALTAIMQAAPPQGGQSPP